MQEDEDTQQEFQATLDSWHRKNPDRPVVIMLAGKSGAGKSTLLNNLLGVKIADTFLTGKSGTLDVTVYKGKCRNVNVTVIDAPGLHILGQKEDQLCKIVAKLSTVTDGKLDLLLYCVNMIQKVDSTDVQIIKSLNKAFGGCIWLHTVLVLTFANIVEDNMKNEQGISSGEYLSEHTDQFRDALLKAGVFNIRYVKSITHGQPSRDDHVMSAVPAGRDEDKSLAWMCGGRKWLLLLLTEIVRSCNVDAIPAVLKLRDISTPILASALAASATAVGLGAFVFGAGPAARRAATNVAMLGISALSFYMGTERLDFEDLAFVVRVRYETFKNEVD